MVKKCTLEIRDEVNIKFSGLDVITRRKLADEVKFFLPYARHVPAFKLGRWDGMMRFCDIGGRSYFHILDKLLPIVVSQGYEIDIEDHRISHDFQFDKVDENSYSDWGPKPFSRIIRPSSGPLWLSTKNKRTEKPLNRHCPPASRPQG